MADRPTMSTSRAGRPRTRLRSVHIPIAHKDRKPRTTSAQRTQTKGKGKITTKKPHKAVAVVSSDSEDLEVDFPIYHPNQPHKVPVNLPREQIHQQTSQQRNKKNWITQLVFHL